MMPSVEELREEFSLYEAPLAPITYVGRTEVLHPVCASIAIGAFDGFHKGHQRLVRALVADAHERGVAAYIVTFDPDPDCVVGPGPAPKLLLMETRLKKLSASGVDGVLVVPFTRELAALDHVAFFEEVLAPVLSIASVHVGSDFKLGRGGSSTVEVIKRWALAKGIDVFGHDLVCADGSAISATRIRRLLAEGKVEDASQLLGRFPLIAGCVVQGRGEGTSMGFPTANIELEPTLCVPADGVYEGIILVDSTVYPAAVNVGLPPMFATEAASAHLEANLIGYEGNLYGKQVKLAFTRFLRPSRVFANEAELIATVLGNIEDIKSNLGEVGVSL